MGDLINLIAIVKGVPTEFTIALSVFAAIIVMWMKSKNLDISAATSISRMQMEQAKGLLEQNRILSEDLKDIREKLTATFEVVSNLRHQLADMEVRIHEYENRCATCPDRQFFMKSYKGIND